MVSLLGLPAANLTSRIYPQYICQSNSVNTKVGSCHPSAPSLPMAPISLRVEVKIPCLGLHCTTGSGSLNCLDLTSSYSPLPPLWSSLAGLASWWYLSTPGVPLSQGLCGYCLPGAATYETPSFTSFLSEAFPDLHDIALFTLNP